LVFFLVDLVVVVVVDAAAVLSALFRCNHPFKLALVLIHATAQIPYLGWHRSVEGLFGEEGGRRNERSERSQDASKREKGVRLKYSEIVNSISAHPGTILMVT
jgi:hypothetical protein